jgi:hypothetical protein
VAGSLTTCSSVSTMGSTMSDMPLSSTAASFRLIGGGGGYLTEGLCVCAYCGLEHHHPMHQ